jgi:hypothetical protein
LRGYVVVATCDLPLGVGAADEAETESAPRDFPAARSSRVVSDEGVALLVPREAV